MDSTNSNISHSSVVHSLDTHVEQLIADHRRLAQLVRELRAQCDGLRAESREQQILISRLQHDLSQSNLVVALTGAGVESTHASESRSRAKAYVNRLMREVDTCITLLSTATGPNGQEGQEVQGGQDGQEGQEVQDGVSEVEVRGNEGTK